MSDSPSLDRRTFYCLHKAIVEKSEKILREEGKKGLLRNTAQTFYGYQEGSEVDRSINAIVQKTLDKRNYKDLDRFRNHSLNGRVLNDWVREYNREKERLQLSPDYYFDAYLFFLEVENVQDFACEEIEVPGKIDFKDRVINSSKSTLLDELKSLKRLGSIVLGISLISLLLLVIKPWGDPPPKSIRVSGEIKSPASNKILKYTTIPCQGIIKNLPKSYHIWLFVERDTLVDGNREVRYWPKEPEIVLEGEDLKAVDWQVNIQENFNENSDYSSFFGIGLYVLDEEAHLKVLDWFEESARIGKYFPMKSVPYFRIPLYRVDNLIIEKNSEKPFE